VKRSSYEAPHYAVFSYLPLPLPLSYVQILSNNNNNNNNKQYTPVNNVQWLQRYVSHLTIQRSTILWLQKTT